MLNIKGIIKSVIVSNLGNLIEDFTEDDIVIDRWNGRIQKENVKIKKDAFEWLTKEAFGAPCTVVKGYIKKLQIDVPWSELQSRPLEITIEDLHVILTSSECYERKFVKSALIELKKQKVEKLLKLIEEQLNTAVKNAKASEQTEEAVASKGFLARITSVILENLRINIRSVHIRFEDNYVSRRDQAFNFGITSESITYSMTNNRFVRAFLNIDDKLQEQRSFSMLKILKLAMYWNSNAQENWTKNREFLHQGAQDTIAFSKNYYENFLMRKHNASKQDFNYSSVFLIQPTDISIKFRTNLAPKQQSQIPVHTTAYELSDLTLSLDEEVLKDIQLLSKFFAWHAMSTSKNGYLKLRPAYNIPVKGNARAYWRYAIKATIYLLRKDRRDPQALQRKRQQEMIELSEVYRLEKINEYFKQLGSKDRQLKIDDRILNTRFRTFRSEAALAKRRLHLEYKLSAEQIVVAIKKAEKESKVFIEAYQQRTGWRAWVPSMLKSSYWYGSGGTAANDDKSGKEASDVSTGSGVTGVGHKSAASQDSSLPQHQQRSAEDEEFYEQLNSILAKTHGFSNENLNGECDEDDGASEEEAKGGHHEYSEAKQRHKLITSHTSISAPLIELLVINKQHGAYNSKCFMSTAIQDLFFQNVAYQDGNKQQLFSIRSFDVIDKLVQSPKFQRTIYKGPIRQPPAQQVPANLASRVIQRFTQSIGGRIGMDQTQSLHEVEEESNLNVNNGLPSVRHFQDINRNVSEAEQHFFIFQMTSTLVKKKKPKSPEGAVDGGGEDSQLTTCQCKYKIDTMLNHTVLFYNRTLISRAQTFFHQATVNKTQNAAAEADFDNKIAAVQKETGEKVSTLLEQNEFEIACALKGIEVLVPDDIDFQESKFILLQTGNIMARSRQPKSSLQSPSFDQINGFQLGPQQQSLQQLHQTVDPLFTSALKSKITALTASEETTSPGSSHPNLDDIDKLNAAEVSLRQQRATQNTTSGLSSPPPGKASKNIDQLNVLRLLEKKFQVASSSAKVEGKTETVLSQQKQKQKHYSQEDYSLSIFDIQVFYLPSFNFLEAIEYNELSKEEAEKRYSLLKRTDVQLELSKILIQKQHRMASEEAKSLTTSQLKTSELADAQSQASTLLKIGLQIANIDFKLTTKEVKDIKYFIDKFIRYHRYLDDQVQEELIKINLEVQFRQNINRNQTNITESLRLQAQQAQIRENLGEIGFYNAASSFRNSNSQGGTPRQEKAISTIQSFYSMPSNEDGAGSSDDEFFDAKDHFDQEIIDLLNMNQMQENKSESTPPKQSYGYPSLLLAPILENDLEYGHQQLESAGKTSIKNEQNKVFKSIAICAAVHIGKFRLQILEASNIQAELVRNLKEKLQTGSYNNNEPIELQIQQKGLPFLNFEISKWCLTCLSAPSLMAVEARPSTVEDIFISTLTVRDFCLMNQEKVQQPQILLRSSNYGIDQAYRRTFGVKERVDSFDHSSEMMKEKNASRRYFDLEEEDNMAMGDQAAEAIDEYFLRVTLGATQMQSFETQKKNLFDATSAKSDPLQNHDPTPRFGEPQPEESKDAAQEAEEEPEAMPSQRQMARTVELYKHVATDSRVDVDFNVGLTEGEITEHSIRKVMECLIQDFPFNSVVSAMTDENQNASRQTTNLEDSAYVSKSVVGAHQQEDDDAVIEQRTIKVNVGFDGFNYKMRVRKEESIVKVIDFSLEFQDYMHSNAPSKRDLKCELTDFQVLHQNNELIFRHSFGSDFTQMGAAGDGEDFDFAGVKVAKIWNLSMNQKGDQKQIRTKLNNLLCIFESKACLQILQNLITLKNITVKSAPRLFTTQTRAQAMQTASKVAQLIKKLQVSVAVNDCHVQLPVQDSKNSLFIELSGLDFDQSIDFQADQKMQLDAHFQAIDIFVAQQINQSSKYYLLQLHQSALTADMCISSSTLNLFCQLGLAKLTANENYLLFLASLIEYHFNDVQALIVILNQLLLTSSPAEADPAARDLGVDRQQSGHSGLDQETLTEMCKSSPFLKSIIAAEKLKDDNSPHSERKGRAQVDQYIKVSIERVVIEWVFGLGFDDHQDNFVTLSNRNFSKLILDQFDRTQQKKVHMLDTSQDFTSDVLLQDHQQQQQEESQLLAKDKIRTSNGLKSTGFTKSNHTGSANNLLQDKLKKSNEDDQSHDKSNYEKLTLCFKEIQIEKAKAAPQTIYSNMTCSQILVDQSSPQLKQAMPILLVRPRSVPKAVSVTSSCSTLKAYISFFDLRVCQRSVTVVSNLVKDVYSCKNVIKRGKKRKFFKALFNSGGSSSASSAGHQDPRADAAYEPAQTSFEVSVDLRKIRVVIYDSVESEAKQAAANDSNFRTNTPAASFVKGLRSQAIDDFSEDAGVVYFNPGSLLTLETGMRIHNMKPVKQQDDDDIMMGDNDSMSNDSQDGGYQPDRQLNAKIQNFTIFTNTKRTTLNEIAQQDQRLMLLYPTDVILGQQFYSQKNLQMIDIQVSLIEFETSFNQVFMFHLLFKKIHDALRPVTQIFESREPMSSSVQKLETPVKLMNSRAITLKHKISDDFYTNLRHHEYIDSHSKSRQSSKGDGTEGNYRSERKLSPKSGVLLSMHVNSIYFALIKETVAGASLARSSTAYMANESTSCMPMLSLEIKWFELRQKTQITGLQQTDVTFPLELYYFNQKLNFFEPVIERVLIKAQTESDVNGNTKKNLNVEDVLNLNFSVALYENMFVLLENLNFEWNQYKKIIEQTERENLIASLRNLNGDKQVSTALQQQAAARDQSTSYGMQRESTTLQSNALNFIKNKTGEILLFKAGRQPAFTEMQANETLPLDFQKNNQVNQVPSSTNLLSAEDTGSKGLFDGVASSEMQPDSDVLSGNWIESSSEEDSELDGDELSNFAPYYAHGLNDLRGHAEIGCKPRSMYRRGKFKFKKSEPNRVICQVLIQHGKDLERTPSFEINFDSLSCQRVFLDENRQLYVICQIQNKDGQKILIVRSPMQVTNNLQIPLEVQLNKSVQKESTSEAAVKGGVRRNLFAREEETKESRRGLLHRQDNFDFCMVIKPEQSMIIPLQACNFKSVKIRPLIPIVGKSASSTYQQESRFEWSQEAKICLLQDEREIFEQKPIIMCSKMTRNNFIVDRNNNQVFFALNSNTYSIRSYIDFNTQQTDFISLRYLSITAPFTIQNLIPVPITMLFKNIERLNNTNSNAQGSGAQKAKGCQKDRQMYDLELKHNSSLQVLYLNPLGNFDFSLAIPGYDHSNFVSFKLEKEEDFELCSDLSQTNYLEAVGLGTDFATSRNRRGSTKPGGADMQQDGANKSSAMMKDQDDAKPDSDYSQLLQTAQFRFVKQKRLLLQLCSRFQSQFNICANIAFVQGFYHISFYAKYWFLNNTQMPLQVRISQKTFSFPTLDMPYQSLDFDFDTAKQFLDRDYGQTMQGKKNAGKQHFDDEQQQQNAPSQQNQLQLQRRDSDNTFKTETVTLREGMNNDDLDVDSAEDGNMGGGVNYRRLKNQIRAFDANGQAYQKGGMLRVKPWEAYRYSESKSKGLLAALSQEDIDRVSSIYFTQEMIKEEEKGEETEFATARDKTKSDAYMTAQTHTLNESSNQDTFMTAMTYNRKLSSNNNESSTRLNQQRSPRDSQEKKPQIKMVQFQLDAVQLDENSHSNSKNSGLLVSQNRLISNRSMDPALLKSAELRSKLSKTSIQMTSFQQQLNEQQAVPLNHTPLSEFELYEAPLDDKDQLKRVILFSDIPTDESAVNIRSGSSAANSTDGGVLKVTTESQDILLRICDSEWSTLPFDLTKLQSEPIQIKDVRRREGQPQSMFELVSVVTFLPQPFSFSKLICFQPRFLMVNRTFHTLYVVQSQCEELGKFKIFPQETSVFHWTDASKPLEVCVTLEEHEYSGNLRIDGIGEFNLRLKSIQEQDSTILNVSISEETNSFYIVFTDVSYAPPYRLENLTKTRFKVAQVKSRQDDFDHLNPFQPLSFAWSYPLQPKLLKINLCQLDSQEELGTFSIDSISKTERITVRDRKNRREFILEITNEKTMKVVRILYPQQTLYEDTMDDNMIQDEDAAIREAKQSIVKAKINRLGLSVVNSQAREICYTSIFNLRFSQESTAKHQKVSFKAQDIQIDNQLSRQNDAIILKREQQVLGHGDFITVKFNFVKNQAIENLLYYKYFILKIVPFELNLDGNFCDETYKYVIDVFQLTSKFTKHSQMASEAQKVLLGDEIGADPTAIKQPNLIASMGDEVDQMKSAFNELKKKGQPYMETQRDVKKIYIEQFQIADIRLSFTFSSSPILFREFTMNPTLKFFLVLLSNLKNVKLHFSKCHLQNQHMQVSIFMAQLKRFYWQECCNHKQLFKIVSSMGLFGSISTTITGISTAFKSLIQRPFITYHEENTLKAILLGSVVFVKDSLYVISGSFGSIYDTFKNGFSVLVAYGQKHPEAVDFVVDRDLFEDDIEQAQRGITSFNTPLTAVDTQNRIWLKILMREKQNYDDKKRNIMRKQQNKIDQSELTQQNAGVADPQLAESLPSTNQASNRYILDSKRAQQDANMLYKLAYYTTQGILFVPRKLFQTSSMVFNSFIPDDITRNRTNLPQKVRPPRFVSFTMELEPYSKKKAFALEVLNDINLDVFETETIHRLYTMNAHVVIITGKRIICVDELRQGQAGASSAASGPNQGQNHRDKLATGSKIMNGLVKLVPRRAANHNDKDAAVHSSDQANLKDAELLQQQAASERQNDRNPEQQMINTGGPGDKASVMSLSDYEDNNVEEMGAAGGAGGFSQNVGFGSLQDPNSAQYKHWNVFFKDIFRVSIDFVDRDTNKAISLEQLFGSGEQNHAAGARQETGQSGVQGAGHGIHGSAADGALGTATDRDTTDRNLKISFVLKIHYQVNDSESEEASKRNKRGGAGQEAGLMGGLSGLKVGRKEIVTKDWKVVRRVYTAIQNYSRRSTLM